MRNQRNGEEEMMTYSQIIAYISMILGHMSFYVGGETMIVLTMVGRLTEVIFIACICDGVMKTRNYRKYLIRLMILAVISEYPYYKMFGHHVNFIWYLVYSAILMRMVVKYESKEYLFMGLNSLLIFLPGSWFYIGCLTIAWKVNDKILRFVIYLIIGLFWTVFVPGVPWYQPIGALGLIVYWLLSGMRVKVNRVVKYGIYPAHLAIMFVSIYYLGF